MLVDDLEVGIGEDLAGAVVAARAKIEFCVLQCDIRGNDSFQSLDAFGDDFLPDAVTGDYCEFQICHVAIVARGAAGRHKVSIFRGGCGRLVLAGRRAGRSAKPATLRASPAGQTQTQPSAQPLVPQVSTPPGGIDTI